jgi:hypothetical protein
MPKSPLCILLITLKIPDDEILSIAFLKKWWNLTLKIARLEKRANREKSTA